MTDRLHWVDITKGIGIIFVIYGHTLGSNGIRHIFYAFHMPLFFFVSGILFHHKKYEHFWTFLIKNIRNILVPYFIFAFLSLCLWYFSSERAISPTELQKQMFGILLGTSSNGYLRFNVSLWFLPCLFVTRIGFYLITSVTEKREYILIILAILSIIGYSLSRFFPDLRFPFGAEAAITGIVFFGLGYLLNSHIHEMKKTFAKYIMAIIPASLLICVVIAQITYEIYGFQIDLRLNRLNNYFLFYAGALSGITCVIAVSYSLGKNKVLEYLGKNSLVLFVWHSVVFVYITKVLRLIPVDELPRRFRDIFMPLFYTFSSIGIILGASSLFRKLHLKFISLK